VVTAYKLLTKGPGARTFDSRRGKSTRQAHVRSMLEVFVGIQRSRTWTSGHHGHPQTGIRRGRQHAADPPALGFGDDRLHDTRQSRVHEPGGTIIEGTAGSAGIGLAVSSRGFLW